jgi:acid phosphatase family membrane protein YuiD
MGNLLDNNVLICCMIAWFLAQILKIPFDLWRTQKIHWGIFFSAGGMPSSHSAMMTATTLGIGLFHGFNDPLFGLAVAISMIVLYDATGVRRQAGMQAQKINKIIDELLQGHPISEKQLKEVLGHTPIEVGGGVILGVAIALAVWFVQR